MSVVRTLQKKIYAFTGGLFATWMPDDRAVIGDYGNLRDGRFQRHSNLKNKGITVKPYVHSGSTSSFKYSDGIAFRASGAAEVDGKIAGAAKVDMNFTKEGAFIYHSQGAKYQKIDNRDEIFAALIKKVTTGEIIWDDEYVLVDEVFHCDHSTILISESKSGAVSVSADTSLDKSENFANADGNLKFAATGGSILNYAGNTNSNPLYHAVRLNFPEHPGGGGSSSDSLMQSIRGKITGWLGINYPQPEEIDVSKHKESENTFIVAVADKNAKKGAKMRVTIETLKVEDLFSSYRMTAKKGPLKPYKKDRLKVDTINLKSATKKYMRK